MYEPFTCNSICRSIRCNRWQLKELFWLSANKIWKSIWRSYYIIHVLVRMRLVVVGQANETEQIGVKGHYLRLRILPAAAYGVFHALSSLPPPYLSLRLSPCRSCLLSFSTYAIKNIYISHWLALV